MGFVLGDELRHVRAELLAPHQLGKHLVLGDAVVAALADLQHQIALLFRPRPADDGLTGVGIELDIVGVRRRIRPRPALGIALRKDLEPGLPVLVHGLEVLELLLALAGFPCADKLCKTLGGVTVALDGSEAERPVDRLDDGQLDLRLAFPDGHSPIGFGQQHLDGRLVAGIEGLGRVAGLARAPPGIAGTPFLETVRGGRPLEPHLIALRRLALAHSGARP